MRIAYVSFALLAGAATYLLWPSQNSAQTSQTQADLDAQAQHDDKPVAPQAFLSPEIKAKNPYARPSAQPVSMPVHKTDSGVSSDQALPFVKAPSKAHKPHSAKPIKKQSTLGLTQKREQRQQFTYAASPENANTATHDARVNADMNAVRDSHWLKPTDARDLTAEKVTAKKTCSGADGDRCADRSLDNQAKVAGVVVATDRAHPRSMDGDVSQGRFEDDTPLVYVK